MHAMNFWRAESEAMMEGNVLLWLVAFGLIVLLSHLAMLWFPAARRRRIFATPAPGVWRWLLGEFSLSATLGGGLAGAGALAWACFALGEWPLLSWGLLLVGGASLTLGVALLNAGRKSRVSGMPCLGLACVVGGLATLGLWMGMQWISRLLGMA